MGRASVTWRINRLDGAYTILDVDIEPGRTAELMIRTVLVGTPDGDAAIRHYADRLDETREQLRDGP